jgi:RNA polymerase sigma factor (TIGR02999 family)
MDITELLARARSGEPERLAEVFEALYPELRRIAQARPGERGATLTPTALVHEAFVRLIENRDLALSDRRHFFACAARAMRCIVLDHARRRHADKRGGGLAPVTLDEHLPVGAEAGGSDVFALDQALDQLERVNPRQREVVELQFFAGLTYAEIGQLLGCAERTAKREWERGRAFLYAHMGA